MIELAIMIEGQNGLNWPRWQRIAAAVEDLGFAGLYRSDHFTNASPPDKDSLELWVSLTWLASHTRRIEFGPLVTPLSFRHPALTARMAAAVDDLSGGRLTLGLGAGWQEREHRTFGFDLLDLPGRMQRFAEGVEVISLLLTSETPVSFTGRFFQLREAILLPRPSRPGGPPILIGGSGLKRTLPLAARFASQWNCIQLTPERFMEVNRHLDGLLRQAGRDPKAVRRTMMTGCILARDEAELARKVAERTRGERTAQDLRQRGAIVGTPAQIEAQLRALEAAGVQRVMLQWLDLDDLQGLEVLARSIH